MARDLKKFVNLRFTKTCDLVLVRRLLARHEADLFGFSLKVLDGPPEPAREALQNFFAGSEDGYPPGLVADLHRIADLANDHGMRLIQERARALGTEIVPAEEAEIDDIHNRIDARHLAIRTFLDHPRVFEAATDFLALDSKVSLTEFSGAEEGVEPRLAHDTRAAFEQAAKLLFVADLMGRYCRIGWYDDDDEINLVVTHGAQITSTPIVKDGTEGVISFRPAAHAVLSYRTEDGRLKVGGVAKAQRGELAEVFADTMLERPGFFDGDNSQNLYTLEAIERKGFDFRFDHAYDPGLRSVKIVEVETQRITACSPPGRSGWNWSLLVKDRFNALGRLGQVGANVTFGDDAYRLSHIVIRVEIDTGVSRPARVSVKIKPRGTVTFKRERFEARIMDLLRRNGLCLE